MVRDGTPMPVPTDDAERRAVVRERERNVVVDAGAGTGKTTLVVDRLVEMIAPEDDAAHAVPLGRLAAVTFTRKAAGELRLRVREQILRALATPGLSTVRRTRLHDAIGTLDHAHIGTIHSFADRLLRMYPVAARLSPTYEIVDDAGALQTETFELLMTSIDRGTLASELAGTKADGRAAAATDIVLAAVEGGLRMESRETPYNIQYGLDALVAGLLEHRDVPPRDVEAGAFDREAFVRSAEEFQVWARQVRGGGHAVPAGSPALGQAPSGHERRAGRRQALQARRHGCRPSWPRLSTSATTLKAMMMHTAHGRRSTATPARRPHERRRFATISWPPCARGWRAASYVSRPWSRCSTRRSRRGIGSSTPSTCSSGFGTYWPDARTCGPSSKRHLRPHLCRRVFRTPTPCRPR